MSDIEKLLSKLTHYNDELTNDDRCDLSDYIEKLQAENAELKRQSQWISVEDELPTVVDSGNWVAVSVLCEDGYVRLYDFNVKSKKWMNGLDLVISKPIKWMPLPTPPEGE